MKLILPTLLGFALLAQDKPKLSDMQKAELYRLIAADTAAQANAQRSSEALKSKLAELEKFCGSRVVEAEGKMADCSEPPKKEVTKK